MNILKMNKRMLLFLTTLFVIVILLVPTSAAEANLSSEDICYDYTPKIVDNVFRYLDEIYIEKYPDMGLRFTYGTPDDKVKLTDLDEVITDHCGTDVEKANAIEKWIQRNISYQGGSAYPADTFYNRVGDCMSYAQLMITLLRLEGIPAVWTDGWRGDMGTLTPEQMFNAAGHAWCFVYLDGEWVLYDPLFFNGGTTDVDFISKWYYCDMVEGIVPIYDNVFHPTQYSVNRFYIDGRFMCYDGDKPTDTSPVSLVNNLFLSSSTKDADPENGVTGNLYVDKTKDFDSMIHGELFRDGFIEAGSLAFVYENAIHASATIVVDGAKQYYADVQSTHLFEILDTSNNYFIGGGYLIIPVGYSGKLFERTCYTDENEYSVVWKSDDPNVVTVDEDGKITTLQQGQVFISAHFYRKSDNTYCGSGCVISLWVSNDIRVADYSDNYNNHEHIYKPIIRDGSSIKDQYVIYTCIVEDCAHSHIGIGTTPVETHNYSEKVTPPTCTESGYVTYTCTCGHEYIVDSGEPTGHTWGEWYTNADTGFVEKECLYCDETDLRDYLAWGTCGNALTWMLGNDGTLTISGEGDMNNYFFSGPEWVDYRYDVTKVIINDGVTSIGSSAFFWHENLVEIQLPETLTSIGELAFHYCIGLASIKIPDNVESIGDSAFQQCYNLIEFNLPNKLTKISDNVFSQCNNINRVIIHEGISKIGFGAFANCIGLETIVFSKSVSVIEQWAFMGCTGLNTIIFEGDLPEIDEEAFSYVCAEAYYPQCNSTWKNVDFSKFNGTIEWIPQFTQHDYKQYTTKPTCTTDGMITYTCSCGDSYVDSYIAALGHTEVVDAAVAPTCTETGLTEGKHCSVCGEVLVAQQTVAALGHSFGEWVVIKPATEESEGLKERVCSACSFKETESIPKLDHVHDYIPVVTPSTCTEQGYTTHTCRCGDSYVDSYIGAKGHSFGEWTVTTAPTCTASGEERRDCANCDHFETRTLSALGHTEVIDEAVAPTCTVSGLTEGKHCSVCSEVLVAQQTVSALGHDFANEWAVDIEPTYESEGQKSRHCSRCDEVTDVIVIAKLVKIVDSSKIFTDLEVKSWSKDGIDYVVSHGYMNGTGNGTTFDQTGTMTRDIDRIGTLENGR